MLYPFAVLDLPHDATDQQVQERYYTLLERFPPDVAPEHFNLIRQAYESLSTQEKRLQVKLFYMGQETEPRFDLLAALSERPRMDVDALAQLLRLAEPQSTWRRVDEESS
ncbi:MAG: J domain-containing protein [Myxococcota bacterium]